MASQDARQAGKRADGSDQIKTAGVTPLRPVGAPGVSIPTDFSKKGRNNMTKKQITFIIKLVTPYLTAVVSALVAWIVSHIHVLGRLNQHQAVKYVVAAVIFGLAWLITYISAHTKLFPIIEKWAGPIIHDLDPLAGQAAFTSPPPVALTVQTSGDVSVHQPGAADVKITDKPKTV
jgi:hypothetical protein